MWPFSNSDDNKESSGFTVEISGGKVNVTRNDGTSWSGLSGDRAGQMIGENLEQDNAPGLLDLLKDIKNLFS